MVRQCVFCKIMDYNIRSHGLSFHRFPTNEIRKNKWVQALGLQGTVLNTKAEICSKHFDPHDLGTKSSGAKYLKPGATPKTNQDPETRRQVEDVCNDFCTPTTAKNKYHMLDITDDYETSKVKIEEQQFQNTNKDCLYDNFLVKNEEIDIKEDLQMDIQNNTEIEERIGINIDVIRKNQMGTCMNNLQNNNSSLNLSEKTNNKKRTLANTLSEHNYVLKRDNNITYFCDECNYKTVYKSELTNHMEKRHNYSDVTYSCDHCDFISHIQHKHSVNNHRTVTHEVIEQACDNCGYKSNIIIRKNLA